ncbi:hypothetical protein PFICI_02946 [Pestalotiopsis fici W106-1]|uniref:HMG box domain-containing protein n=1 Tax=Pestalotiopsis fici (strain W106-1 / CGMCC3.15140) TaxID=1229662 RepID=W3XI49_PESFW|nr:uncharacterized protein PFICI_02946 [Pestalotiopsis fici W106-1]ETS84921.1 hypothetical protein PFICI_02946 [Pestalotiopsis fici W106-1]
MCKDMKIQRPELKNNEISKVLGDMWNAMSEDEKGIWRARQEKAREEHEKKYPDYRYNPLQAAEKEERERKKQEERDLKKKQKEEQKTAKKNKTSAATTTTPTSAPANNVSGFHGSPTGQTTTSEFQHPYHTGSDMTAPIAENDDFSVGHSDPFTSPLSYGQANPVTSANATSSPGQAQYQNNAVDSHFQSNDTTANSIPYNNDDAQMPEMGTEFNFDFGDLDLSNFDLDHLNFAANLANQIRNESSDNSVMASSATPNNSVTANNEISYPEIVTTETINIEPPILHHETAVQETVDPNEGPVFNYNVEDALLAALGEGANYLQLGFESPLDNHNAAVGPLFSDAVAAAPTTVGGATSMPPPVDSHATETLQPVLRDETFVADDIPTTFAELLENPGPSYQDYFKM